MLDKQDIIIFVLAIIFMTIAAYNIDSFFVQQGVWKMERKFEITIQTDVNDPYEPNEKELREFLQLCLSRIRGQCANALANRSWN